MRRSWSYLFTILALIAMSICSACVSPFAPADKMPVPNETPKIDVGVVAIERTQAREQISLYDAKSNLKDSELLSLNEFPQKTKILFIQGINLDESGKAGQWIFGINKGDINELRVYDRSSWTIISWNDTIPAEEIDTYLIVSPEALFNLNRIQILDNSPSTMPVQRDIELKNGTYRITITSGGTSRILMFNATTGAAIGLYD